MMWRRLLSNALVVSLMATGLVVIAQPQAHAAADAVVSGTVVDSVTNQPLASVTITDSTSGRTTTTAVAGTYSLSVPAGDHVLTATLVGYVPSSRPALTLAEGQALSSQGFTLMKYGSASGTVIEEGTGAGIAGVSVKLFEASSQSPNAVFAATTGPDGSWSLAEVAPGSYRVQFDSSDAGYRSTWFGGASRDAATVVAIAPDGSRIIDATLTRGKVAATAIVRATGVASLSGHVLLDPGATPVADATVSAYMPNGGIAGTVTTDASGAYSLPSLSAGYYLIRAQTAPYDGLVAFLGGAVSGALATYVWVADGAVLAGQDIHLQKNATLTGTVTQNGSPVASPGVGLYGMGTSLVAQTAGDGTFTFTQVPPGKYRLSATTDHTAWWNGAAEVGGATEITVPADGHLSGLTIVMPPTFTLSGTVKTAGGAAVPNTKVLVQNGIEQRIAVTDAAGAYSLKLVAATYELAVMNAAATAYVWSPGSATPAPFAVSTDTVRNVTMPLERTVTLPVIGSDGSVPPYVTISASTASHGTFVGAASSTGTVTLNLPVGTYRLDSQATGYLPWSAQITVAAAMTVPATLQVAGRISGVISGTWASVTALNTTTGVSYTNVVPGAYSFSELPLGDYVVTADPFNANMAKCGPPVWFGGTSYLTARRLQVTDVSPLGSADFALTCPATWARTSRILGDVALPASAPAGAASGVVVSVTNGVASFTSVPDTDGNYSLTDMQPGTYDVAAYHAVLGLEAHATITIAAGQTTMLTLNLTRRGKVTGQVVGPNGEAVQASVANGETSVGSDALGAFSLGGISYGTHTLTIKPSAPYATAVVSVTVGPGSDVTGLVVHVPLAGRMQGYLPLSAGTVEVTVYDATGRIVDAAHFVGAFDFWQLPSGVLRVRFSGPGIVTEWWKDAATLAGATGVVVPPGGGVANIAPTLTVVTGSESMTTVSGKVTYAGNPLAGVTITAAGTGAQFRTGGDGTYSLSVPRDNTYTVAARICLGTQWYPCVGQDYSDTRTVVADAATKAGVDFVVPLPPNTFTSAVQPVVTGKAISGQVLTATVGAWTPVVDSMTWQWYADSMPIYQATGTTFTLTDAQAGKVVQVIATGAKAGYATTTLPSAVGDPVEVPGGIHSLSPSRLLDSRSGLGFSGPAGNGTVITLPVWGKGGVPAGASAVLMNLTVTQPTAGGFVTAYASGGTVPGVSNANFTSGTTLANLSLVPVGADGAIALRTTVAGSVHVIADVQGYVVGGTVTAAGALVPVTPARVFDSRNTTRVAANTSVDIVVAGVAGVPTDATAVVANLTVTGPARPGYLTAWPTGVARPTASNVNFVVGQTVPNMAILKVGANGRISIYNSAASAVDVIVDLQGYVTAGTPALAGTVKPITPTRVLDTRNGYYPVPGNDGGWVDFDSPDLASFPQGVLVNLTVAEPQTAGWLSAYPYGVERPVVSNLNYTAGAVVPNLALVALTDGYAMIYNGSIGSTHVIIDVFAYVLS